MRREDDLYRDLEVGRQAERQEQAGAVFAAFQVADRLVVDAEGVGEVPSGDSALGAEHRDPVVDDLAAHVARSIARSRRAATRDPDSRRAIRRSTAGADARPSADHASRMRRT